MLRCRYASRVKLITNDAQKNADNKEISRLKNVRAAQLSSHCTMYRVPYSLVLLSCSFQIILQLKNGGKIEEEVE